MNGHRPSVRNTIPFSVPLAVRYGESAGLVRFRRHKIADKSLRYLPCSLCSPSDPRVPSGLSYHLSEIWLTELDKASAIATTQKPIPMKPVLAPFLALAARAQNRVTYQQIETNLIDPLLSALSPPPGLADQPPPPKRLKASSTRDDLPNLLANSCLSPQDEPSDRSQLRKGVLKYIFEVASQEDSRDSNRRKLYAICNANLDDDDDA